MASPCPYCLRPFNDETAELPAKERETWCRYDCDGWQEWDYLSPEDREMVLAEVLQATRQTIAQVVHDGLWAHWMDYFFSVCEANADGSLTIPAGYVQHWRRQMATTYADLPPQEQESDLEQADKVLAALAGTAVEGE